MLTDGSGGCNELSDHSHVRKKTVLSGAGILAHVAMPAVHRVASLIRRWLLGTHRGAVRRDHPRPRWQRLIVFREC